MVAASLVLASFVHASFGFGTALVAMPLLSLLVGVHVATPVVGAAALVTIVVLLLRDWRSTEFLSAWRLIAASLVGIPLGLYLLQSLNPETVQVCLGLLLLANSAFNLSQPQFSYRAPQWMAYPVGVVAGALGAAYNTNAPPVVIYGLLAGWEPARFRATLQGFFLPSAVIICAGHVIAGMWTPEVMVFASGVLPAVLIGNGLGFIVGKRLTAAKFERLLHLFLAVLGLLMLF